ncbi:MAG: alpha/beta fold hydrolase [Oscillospiraceae bacterium]|nr:alpha/beta fold hydrolase [Oscillospiraceae bacterium]
MDKIYIIIHGFAGGLYEIEPLYDFLQSENLNVHCITLAGHGKTRKDLSGFSYKDWIESAVVQVKNIKKEYSKKGENAELNLIGFSMGGLICANLTDYFDISKIVFVNTPVYYWKIGQIVKNIFSDIRQRSYSNINHYRQSFAKAPFKALINFLILLNKTKDKFSSVCVKRANPLILQCLDDDTVKSKSAGFIKNKIGANARIIYYKTGGHRVFYNETADKVRDKICTDIYDYLQK